MSKEKTTEVFCNYYMCLYSDGTIGMSDGVGYCGELSREESYELFCALRKFFTPSRYPVKNRLEAEDLGFLVDTGCYPWVAYKGSRFQPDEWFQVLTDLEAGILEKTS